VLIDEEMEKIAEAIQQYAKKHKVEALEGTDARVVLNKKQYYDLPSKSSDLESYEIIETILKNSKYWDVVSAISVNKLALLLDDDALPTKLKQKIIALAPLKEDVTISIRKK
jgi:hypothetical protein